MPKIGVTEAGDASLDYSWMKKADDMDMLVLITKNVTDEFIKKALLYEKKAIVHATCTGMGGTILEPCVPAWRHQVDQVVRLIHMGFPEKQVVLRIDPLFPTEKGLRKFEEIVDYAHSYIKRYRISVIDNYKHVKERFKAAGLPILYGGNFIASDEEFGMVDSLIKKLKLRYPDISIECCAEPKLEYAEHIGCVSSKDLALFGLKPSGVKQDNRYGCLCEAKNELLPFNHYWWCSKHSKHVSRAGSCECGNCKGCKNLQVYGCANRCLYCYWKT